jgi:predicted transcriptional regulator
MSFATTGIYSRKEFAAQQAAGNFHPNLTYERYVELRRLRAERKQRELLELYGTDSPAGIEEAPTLTPQDETALEMDWATTSEEEQNLIAA